jgi:hypothetical protein
MATWLVDWKWCAGTIRMLLQLWWCRVHVLARTGLGHGHQRKASGSSVTGERATTSATPLFVIHENPVPVLYMHRMYARMYNESGGEKGRWFADQSGKQARHPLHYPLSTAAILSLAEACFIFIDSPSGCVREATGISARSTGANRGGRCHADVTVTATSQASCMVLCDN